MCVILKKWNIKRTAKKDIIVTKLYFDHVLNFGVGCINMPKVALAKLTLDDVNSPGRELASIVMNHRVILGETISTELRLKYTDSNELIGLYSYEPNKIDSGWAFDYYVECVIPKGTKYYHIGNQYVSEQLVIGKIIDINLD